MPVTFLFANYWWAPWQNIQTTDYFHPLVMDEITAEIVRCCRQSHNKVIRVFWRWGFALCPVCGREGGLGWPMINNSLLSVLLLHHHHYRPIVSCLQPMTEPAFLKSVSVSGCNAAAPADHRGVESVGFITNSISLHTSWHLFYLRNRVCCLLHFFL